MFEQAAVKNEKDRSRTIMIVSGLAVLAVIALIIIVTSFGRRPSQMELAERGSPEFDTYADSILLGDLDKWTGERITGRYVRMKCTVQNAGDKILTGLQFKAIVIGTGGQVLREKVITPVPNSKDTLGPNESMKIEASLERVPDPTEISDMKIELLGLRTK